MSQIVGDLSFHQSTSEEKVGAASSIFKEENSAQGTASSSRILMNGHE